jgi:cbb3-type cytochrome oxidase subunit 3
MSLLKKILTSTTFIVLFLFFLSPVVILAFSTGDVTELNQELGLPLADVNTVEGPALVFVAEIIRIVLSFIGVIFLVLIIYAGFLWMTAAGEEAKAGKARSIIFDSVVGLAIIIFSYAITTFVLGIFFSTQSTQ